MKSNEVILSLIFISLLGYFLFNSKIALYSGLVLAFTEYFLNQLGNRTKLF